MAQEAAPPLVTPFDNELTLLYKWAEYYQLTIRLVLAYPPPPGATVPLFESLLAFVPRLVAEGQGPAEIYELAVQLSRNLAIEDVGMAYYLSLREKVPDEELLARVNQFFYQIDNELGEQHFTDMPALLAGYADWYRKTNTAYQRDMRRLAIIRQTQATLTEVSQYPPLPLSPVTINSAVLAFRPTWLDGRVVTELDGVDIFNAAVPTRFVPFIRYNDGEGKAMFRVYTASRIEDSPNYDTIVISSVRARAKHTLYFTLWVGNPTSSEEIKLNEAPRESFRLVIYHLDNNYLTIETPVHTTAAMPYGSTTTVEAANRLEEGLAIRRVQQALPQLTLGTSKEVKVRGEFTIWNAEYRETSLLDMILLDPLLNVYLYVEENTKPFALRKRLDIYYRSIASEETEGKRRSEEGYIVNPAAISLIINQRTLPGDAVQDIFEPTTGVVTKVTMPAGTRYLHFNITQAESRATVEKFIPIFRLLIQYYMNNELALMYQVYLPYLPQLTELPALLESRRQVGEVPAPVKGRKGRRAESENELLKAQAPEIFQLGYARRCLKGSQPTIIRPEDIPYWRSQLVPQTGQERQVMAFPVEPGRKQYFFVCPNNKAPYPGLKANRTMANVREFPYIPCCSKTDQLSPWVPKSSYKDYLAGIPPRPPGAKASTRITSRKIMAPAGVAQLPQAVQRVLSRYVPDSGELLRYGVPRTHNSFLHCVLAAVNDSQYAALPDVASQEQYVVATRLAMAQQLHPTLLRQELYDYPEEQIRQDLANSTLFFDPALFYRAVEEWFQVNIYVFTTPISGEEAEIGYLDIPRFKVFHARPLREYRPTIVLMKTWGSESDALTYPQCELIIDNRPKQRVAYRIFGVPMTRTCQRSLLETLQTYTWSYTATNGLQVGRNIYYAEDPLTLLRSPPIAQYLDNYGKLRALIVRLPVPAEPTGQPAGQPVGEGELLTLVTIPGQPLNLPVVKEIPRVLATTAIQLYGSPVAVSKDESGTANGFWYDYQQIKRALYVPIQPNAEYNQLPSGPVDPVRGIGRDLTIRLTKLRRDLSLITQVLKWLYEISKLQQPTDPASFVTNYLVADQAPVADSAQYYDLSRLPRLLPVAVSVEEAITALSPLVPTLCQGGKIIMYDTVFASRIARMLKDYHEIRLGLPGQPPLVLQGYFHSEADFRVVPESRVFINEADLTTWLTATKTVTQNYSKFFGVRQKITASLIASKQPYLLQDAEGYIYLVQNVLGGAKEAALAVALLWYRHRTNIGATNIQPLNPEALPAHVVFAVTAASAITPVANFTVPNASFLRILYYGSAEDYANKVDKPYAAMLDLA